MPVLSLRIREELDKRLQREARLDGLPRSEVMRIAISEYLSRRERERFLADLVAEAQTANANAPIRHSALEMAEEGMAASNEALDRAEERPPGGLDKPEETWWK